MRFRLIIISLLLAVLPCMGADAAFKIAKKVSGLPALKDGILAVLDITDPSGKTNLESRYIADRIHEAIMQKGSVQLADRQTIYRTLKKKSLSMTNINSNTDFARLGEALHADALIIGTYTSDQGKKEYKIRIIECSTGSTLSTISASEKNVYVPGGPVALTGDIMPFYTVPVKEDRETVFRRNFFLTKLKAHEPKKYKALLKAEKYLTELYQKDKDIFILATESPQSGRLMKIYRENKDVFFEAIEKRKKLNPLNLDPVLKERIEYARREILNERIK